MSTTWICFAAAAEVGDATRSVGALSAVAPRMPVPEAAAITAGVGSPPSMADCVLLDNFNRPDGTDMGPSWVEQSNNFSIETDRATGDNLSLMTFVGATADTLCVDTFIDGPKVQYTALVLRYANNSNNVFIKVQDNDANGTYDRAYFYYGNNGGGGWSDSVALTEFTSARLLAHVEGTDVTLQIDTNFDNVPDQQHTVGSLPTGSLGTGVGLGAYNGALMDDFRAVVPQICGNTVLDAGEECDDGNTTDGDCCSSTCEIEAAGTECRAATGVCDMAEECDGLSPTCPGDAWSPGGTDCSDADLCNGDESCDGAGSCQAGTPLDCEDGSACTTDTCSPSLGCMSSPASGCLDTFEKGVLLVNEKTSLKEKVTAKFTKGPGISQTDWGNPLDPGGTAYELCIFDGDQNLAGSFTVDRAGETCEDRDCWKKLGKEPPDGKGYTYKDKSLASDGSLLVKLKGGDTGKSRALWKAQNKLNTMPTGIASALQNETSVTVQIHAIPAGTVCLSMDLPEVKKNDGSVFKAKK